jgi:hypothetical protein
MERSLKIVEKFGKRLIIKDNYLYFYIRKGFFMDWQRGQYSIGIDTRLLKYCRENNLSLRVIIGKRKIHSLQLKGFEAGGPADAVAMLLENGETILFKSQKLLIISKEAFGEVPVDREVYETFAALNGACRFMKRDQFNQAVCMHNPDAPGTCSEYFCPVLRKLR